MRYTAVLAAMLFCGSAHASLDGMRRISILPGWRYTPNDYFAASAVRAGSPLEGKSPGGPHLSLSFGYMASEQIEVGIDLLGGYESLKLRDKGELSSFTYGGLLQLRSVFDAGILLPYVGAGLGPILALVQGIEGEGNVERLITGYSLGAGASLRLDDKLALTLDAKWLLARGVVPGVGGINAGGLFAGIGLTWLLPRRAFASFGRAPLAEQSTGRARRRGGKSKLRRAVRVGPTVLSESLDGTRVRVRIRT